MKSEFSPSSLVVSIYLFWQDYSASVFVYYRWAVVFVVFVVAIMRARDLPV